jgi:hypothetical protein
MNARLQEATDKITVNRKKIDDITENPELAFGLPTGAWRATITTAQSIQTQTQGILQALNNHDPTFGTVLASSGYRTSNPDIAHGSTSYSGLNCALDWALIRLNDNITPINKVYVLSASIITTMKLTHSYTVARPRIFPVQGSSQCV